MQTAAIIESTVTHACDTADIEHARGISSEEAREAVSMPQNLDLSKYLILQKLNNANLTKYELKVTSFYKVTLSNSDNQR